MIVVALMGLLEPLAKELTTTAKGADWATVLALADQETDWVTGPMGDAAAVLQKLAPQGVVAQAAAGAALVVDSGALVAVVDSEGADQAGEAADDDNPTLQTVA
jgi:hypothetical protein